MHAALLWFGERNETLRPPPSLNATCRGGSPLLAPPAPGAYAPLTGAGCGAPLEMIVEMVVVEEVAELSAKMAVEVVLSALLPPRGRSTAVLAASFASPCEHSHTLFFVRLDGQRMSQRCVLFSAAAIASCLRRNFAGLWSAEHRRLAHPSPRSNRARPPARACLRAASRSTRAWQPGVAHAMVSACAVVSPARVASDFPGFGFLAHAPQARSAVQRAGALGSRSCMICPPRTG